MSQRTLILITISVLRGAEPRAKPTCGVQLLWCSDKFDVCVTVHHWYNSMNSQLDATIIILLIISVRSTCFGLYYRPKHVELIEIINKIIIVASSWLHYWCSDNYLRIMFVQLNMYSKPVFFFWLCPCRAVFWTRCETFCWLVILCGLHQ